MNNEKITLEKIKSVIKSNDAFAVLTMKKIYQYQTIEEQNYGDTIENNSVGFSGADANILSSFTEQVLRWESGDKRYNTPLSQKQMDIVRKKMIKYVRQLSGILVESDFDIKEYQKQEIDKEPITKNYPMKMNWSEPKRVHTKNGYRILVTSKPDEKFWIAWKENKQSLKDKGISVSKDEQTGEWEVQWWKPDKKAEKTKVESKLVSTDIDLPLPEGLSYFPFQKAGIKFAMSRKSTLFAEEMGLGKTIESIGTINTTKKPGKILVVSPKRLKINWRNELEKWLIHDLSISIIETGDKWVDGDVVIINYDLLKNHSKKIHSIKWNFIIIDEAHYLKNPKSKRTKVLFGDNKEMKPVEAKHKLLLTGTPILNRPVEGFPLFHYLDPIEFKSFMSYAKKYCDAHHTQWGWDFSGASNTKQLQDKIRSLFMIRRLKVDVLSELPPKQRQIIEIPANGNSKIVERENKVANKYETKREELRIKAEISKALENQEEYNKIIKELKVTSTAMFTEMSKVRHETAVAKIPDVCDHIENMFEQDIKKIVLFAHHRDVIKEIHNHFKDCSVTLIGGMSTEQSETSINEFQNNDKVKLFIGNIQAAGVGITLTAAHYVVFAELDWVPANMNQAEDRCHRIGQKESVLIQHLVLEDSFDARMAQSIIEKQSIIDDILDNEIDMSISKEPSTTIDLIIKKSVVGKPIDKTEWNTDMKKHLLKGLSILSAHCDGAIAKDHMGFNKFDTRIGKALSELSDLSDRQATIAHRLIIKYKRQLPEEILEVIKKDI